MLFIVKDAKQLLELNYHISAVLCSFSSGWIFDAPFSVQMEIGDKAQATAVCVNAR